VNPIKNATQPLIEQVRKKREEAEKQNLNEAVDMFKRLEAELTALQKETKLDTTQSLAKLNDIREQLQKRREEVGSAEALKKNLAGLEKLEAGLAEKLGEALKQGDFDKAQQELDKLREQLQSPDGLSQEALEKMAEQLEKLEQALREASDKHEAAKQALEQQMKQAEAAGDLQQAAQLERKLAQLRAADSQMKDLQKLADALSQCQNCMKSGDSQSAQEALANLAAELSEMSSQSSELQELDQLLDSLSQSKSQMKCSQCQGMGCSACRNGGKPLASDEPGRGLGEGRGEGERPEEETDADFFESRVREQMKQGETRYGGRVGGANRKGTTSADVQEAVLASLTEEPEPLENQALPRAQREHAREYFNKVREGK
jgi:uncharacterized phage infection (PIP) family protein YhgE